MRKVNVTAEMKELFENHGIALNSADLREQICAQDSKEFFKTLLWLFGAVVQLRYEDSENDFILSPIEVDGRFFDSRTAQAGEPCDGDANGAYHIALQGLRMLNRIEAGRIKPDEKNKQLYNWLKFTQSKHK